jgi:hypothetical protein
LATREAGSQLKKGKDTDLLIEKQIVDSAYGKVAVAEKSQKPIEPISSLRDPHTSKV